MVMALLCPYVFREVQKYMNLQLNPFSFLCICMLLLSHLSNVRLCVTP